MSIYVFKIKKPSVKYTFLQGDQHKDDTFMIEPSPKSSRRPLSPPVLSSGLCQFRLAAFVQTPSLLLFLSCSKALYFFPSVCLLKKSRLLSPH